jgi:hypothetical protein
MKKCANSNDAIDSSWNPYTIQNFFDGFLGLLAIPPFHILTDLITQIIIADIHPE